MRCFAPLDMFDPGEEDRIHQAALRILDRTGVMVESPPILARLAELGARVDPERSVATFPTELVEGFLAATTRFDWRTVTPGVNGHAGTFFGYYLDPDTDRHTPWTVPNLLRYLKVAHHLPHTSGSIAYAYPIDGVPDQAQVPFFHYLSLKFKGSGACSINNVRWCGPVLDLLEAAAADRGVETRSLFRGHVHLISPLKLGREEAKIYLFFAERGLQLGVSNMSSAGGTAPVTMAGALAIHLAQALFISFLQRAWFGGTSLSLGCSISPLDMRTGMYPYGRPEKELWNVAMAQMARRYGASFGGHCGHADAKRPGVEAGFQRALNSIPTLLACGRTSISCGLLSVDEVFSPVQMVLDDEIVSALDRYARGFVVDDESLALDLIEQVGPGGCFLATEHTARHHRAELWEPRCFSRLMFARWREEGGRSEVDQARDIVHELLAREPLPSLLSDDVERRLLEQIHQATGVSLRPIEPV